MTGRVEVRDTEQRRADRDDAGFTLVEAVISMLLLAILSVSAIAGVLSTMRAADQMRSRTVATELATREVAAARQIIAHDAEATKTMLEAPAVNPTPLDGSAPAANEPLVVDGRAYTVRRTVTLSSVVGGSSVCGSSTNVTGTTQLVVQIAVEVTWTDRASVTPVRLVERTVLPDATGTEATSQYAFIAVQVSDPTGADRKPVGGATVAIKRDGSDQSTAEGVTDAQGCALLRIEKTGAAIEPAYTAVVAKGGYVSEAWTGAAGHVLGQLTYGVTTKIDVAYALNASIRVRFTTPDGTAEAPDIDYKDWRLTLVCSDPGTIASGVGLTTVLTGDAVVLDQVWPCDYAAYVSPADADDLPNPLPRVDVLPGASADLWVRPGVGIVPPPTGPAPEPTPSTSSSPGEGS